MCVNKNVYLHENKNNNFDILLVQRILDYKLIKIISIVSFKIITIHISIVLSCITYNATPIGLKNDVNVHVF